jgi:hypothetical protein
VGRRRPRATGPAGASRSAPGAETQLQQSPADILVEHVQNALQTRPAIHRFRTGRPLRPGRQQRRDQRPQFILHDPRPIPYTSRTAQSSYWSRPTRPPPHKIVLRALTVRLKMLLIGAALAVAAPVLAVRDRPQAAGVGLRDRGAGVGVAAEGLVMLRSEDRLDGQEAAGGRVVLASPPRGSSPVSASAIRRSPCRRARPTVSYRAPHRRVRCSGE